jgi:hypothetical protein
MLLIVVTEGHFGMIVKMIMKVVSGIIKSKLINMTYKQKNDGTHK